MQQFIFNLTEENAHELIQKSQEKIMLFYFYSAQIEECKRLEQILTQLANEKNGQFLLVNVDCEKYPQIAAQFGLRTIPTVYLFKNGQPIDGFEGEKSNEEIRTWLANHLPKEELIKAEEGRSLLFDGKFTEAIPILKQAWKLSEQKNSDIAFLLASAYLKLNQFGEAEKLLEFIPIQDQNTEFQSIKAKIELQKQAANTPEIQELQQKIAQNQDDFQAIAQLGLQLNQVGRNEEALKLLFLVLQKNLDAGNGEIKAQFLDILSALGTDSALAMQFRRKFYSLLY